MSDDYGSFHNQQYARYQSPEPEVGMGATEISWTDRTAYTVVAIVTKRVIEVQRDKAIRVDTNGMSESQSYRYEPDPYGMKYRVSKHKDGTWRFEGTKIILALGFRDEYYDYSF